MRQDRWIAIDELSEYLKISRAELYRMARESEIPASKVGGRWRFQNDEIKEWMKARKLPSLGYVHGYSSRENRRLVDQATTLVELLHSDSIFEPGAKVLEAGCGVGAQTVTLAGKNPKAKLISVDISEESLKEAKRRVAEAGVKNVKFQKADIFALPFEEKSFDHVFVCFVLEHLSDPVKVLRKLKRFLKPGGTITAIEGDHGSVYFHPDSEKAHKAIQCQIMLQKNNGGNALIGRELYPLLVKSGFKGVRVSPRMVYVDSSRPELVEGFTKNTFTAMIEGVREEAIAAKLMGASGFDKGVKGLYRTTEKDGVFCYTFFKAWGKNR